MSWRTLHNVYKKMVDIKSRHHPDLSRVMPLVLSILQSEPTDPQAPRPQSWDDVRLAVEESMMQVLPAEFAPRFDVVKSMFIEVVDAAELESRFIANEE